MSAAAGIAGGIMQSNAAIKAGSRRPTLRSSRASRLPPTSSRRGPRPACRRTRQQSDLLGLNGQPAADAAMAHVPAVSPGYQFQLQQGLRAVDAGAAAQGMLRIGATLKAEETFGQGLANQRLRQLLEPAAAAIGQRADGGERHCQRGDRRRAANIASTDTGAAAAQASIYGNMASSIGTSANGLMNNQGFQSWLGGAAAAAAPHDGFNQPISPASLGIGQR